MNDRLRIFFAITLPKKVLQSVVELLSLLKKRYPLIKWTRDENLHITLQFLGALQPQDLSPLITQIQHSLLAVHPFQIQFDQLELFPTIDRPAVISLCAVPNEPQAELAAIIGKTIQAANYEIEHRAFRSHLTLARLDRSCNIPFDFSSFHIPTTSFCVDTITLFQSEPSKAGSRYLILHTFKLR